ncbi:hypothetical protein H2204_002383 [Knufia peltigerae]|uniref:Uncharacterized protein n=1 Tax=Knufia peltigerae TaxID=1002370 RepID=A0AA38YBU6_9EURO|nr:hypothetical protein H2204_002383 [Knufia peltigerae]
MTREPKPQSQQPQPQPGQNQLPRRQEKSRDGSEIDETVDPVYSQPLASRTTQINDPVYGQLNSAQSKPEDGEQKTPARGKIKPSDDPVYSQSRSTNTRDKTTRQEFNDPVYGQPLPPPSSSSSSSSPPSPPPGKKGTTTINPSDDPVYSQPQSRNTRNASNRIDQLSSQISPPSASEPDASVDNTKHGRSKS